MARIPGIGRSSASPSLESKDEHERDVALLSRKDSDRWEKKTGDKEMGIYFIPEGGRRMVLRVGR